MKILISAYPTSRILCARRGWRAGCIAFKFSAEFLSQLLIPQNYPNLCESNVWGVFLFAPGVSAPSALSAVEPSPRRTGCARRANTSTTWPASRATPASANCPPARSSRCTTDGCSAKRTTSTPSTEAALPLTVRPTVSDNALLYKSLLKPLICPRVQFSMFCCIAAIC